MGMIRLIVSPTVVVTLPCVPMCGPKPTIGTSQVYGAGWTSRAGMPDWPRILRTVGDGSVPVGSQPGQTDHRRHDRSVSWITAIHRTDGELSPPRRRWGAQPTQAS